MLNVPGFILLVLLSLAAFFAVLVWMVAQGMLYPARMSDGKALFLLRRLSPADIGLPFEPWPIQTTDARTGKPLWLAAWWIPAEDSERLVILLHGYADAKVGAAAWAPLFHAAGWNVLIPDMRSHGESGGEGFTAGYWERHDLKQLIDQVLATRGDKAKRIVAAGVSSGGAVALALAALDNRIAATIADSPFSSYEQGTIRAMRHRHWHGPHTRPALRLAQRLARADFAEVAPTRTIGAIASPVMLIHSHEDPIVPKADQALLDAAMAERNDFLRKTWHAPEGGHLEAWPTMPGLYAREVLGFLRDAVK